MTISYKFAPGVEPNTFVFPTDSGWLYSVAFINNSYLFRGNTLRLYLADTYHAGMFVHFQHPNYKLIPEAFESFLEKDVTNGKLVNRR